MRNTWMWQVYCTFVDLENVYMNWTSLNYASMELKVNSQCDKTGTWWKQIDVRVNGMLSELFSIEERER